MNKVIHTPLILASQSQSRAQILSQIGLMFQSIPSGVDEDVLKIQGQEGGWPIEKIAMELARAKAQQISDQYNDALVIGADQIMSCDGFAFDKAQSLEEAKEQLRFISGKPHFLHTACVLFHAGQEIWSNLSTPILNVRSLTEEFIQDYVTHLGDDALRSVGCYQIEGRGAQLFDRIDGDIFTIMGLPAFPLLQELRQRRVILS